MSEEMAGKPTATHTDASTSYTVFISTSLGTNFVTNVADSDIVSDFKKKVLVEHTQCFPELGDVKINSLKVKRGGCFYHLAESMIVKSAFHGLNKHWCIGVDACRVEPCVGVGNGLGSMPLNGIGKMPLDSQAKGLVSGVDLPCVGVGNGLGSIPLNGIGKMPLDSQAKGLVNGVDLPCVGVGNGLGSMPLNGIGKMPLDSQAKGLDNGVDLSWKGSDSLLLEAPKVDQGVEQKTPILDDNVGGEANVSREGVAKKKGKRSKNDLPLESSKGTSKVAAIGEDNEDYLSSGHLGSGKKKKKKKTSHSPPDQEIAAVQSSGADARCENSVVPVGTSSNNSGEETAAATVQDVNEKLLSQDVDMDETNPVNVESQHDLSKPAAAPDATEIKDSRITENETDVVARPEYLEVGETANPQKSSKKRKKSKTTRDSLSRQPLTSDAEQVEGPVPVISSTAPHQAVSRDQSNQDNPEKKAMEKGDDASETAMVNDFRFSTSEHLEVVGTVSSEKASKKRRKSKRSRHSPLLDAEQVEGSKPDISSNELEQTNNGNDPFRDNREERTMKEGEGNDLRVANFELHEVVEPENLEKSSKKRRKSKKASSQTPTSDAAQVEGSLPLISLTEPHQTVNGNHSDQDKREKETMKGGQGASETAMVGDLRLATDKEINDVIANVVESAQMNTTHSDAGIVNNPPTRLDSITPELSHVPAHKLDGSSEGRRLEAAVNSPSKNAHADKPRNDAEVSDESHGINFTQYFVPSNQHEKGTSSELVEKAPNAKGAGSETKSEKKKNMKSQTKVVHGHHEGNRANGRKPPLTDTVGDARASTNSSRENPRSTNFQNKLAHGHQEHSRVDGRKPSSTNTRVAVSGPARGKSLIGKSGTIFDDDKLGNSSNEDGPDDSDASTRTPSDYSLSSDYTDGESSSVLNTSQNGSDGSRRKGTDRKSIPNLLSSGMSLDRILKSSSRFKKAKLAASQSELEDTGSQAVDFVPDSQARP